MARKTALILAAIIVPGGFIALIGGWLLNKLSQTQRGRRVVDLARQRVPAWMAVFKTPIFQRRAA